MKKFILVAILSLALVGGVANAAITNVVNNGNDSKIRTSYKSTNKLNLNVNNTANVNMTSNVALSSGNNVKVGDDMSNSSVTSGAISYSSVSDVAVNSVFLDVETPANSTSTIDVTNSGVDADIKTDAEEKVVTNVTDTNPLSFNETENLAASAGNTVDVKDDASASTVTSGSLTVTKGTTRQLNYREYRIRR